MAGRALNLGLEAHHWQTARAAVGWGKETGRRKTRGGGETGVEARERRKGDITCKGSRGFHEGGLGGSQDPLILLMRLIVSNQITEPLATSCKYPKGDKGQSGSRTTMTPILGDSGCL